MEGIEKFKMTTSGLGEGTPATTSLQ